jgi:hypothetical protein
MSESTFQAPPELGSPKTCSHRWLIAQRHLPALAKAIANLPQRVGPLPNLRKHERFQYTQELFDRLRNQDAGEPHAEFAIQNLATELQRHWEHGEADFPALVKWILKRELDQ